VGDSLQTAAPLDFEAQASYSVRVRSEDAGGLSTEVELTITATDVNEAPSAIALSNSTVAENEPAGAVVGQLTTTDQDAGDTHTYTLVAGTGDADNGSFTIVGDSLQTAAPLDFEAQASYSVRVRSEDAGGLSSEVELTITATDVNEVPTLLALSNDTLAENEPIGTVVGLLTTTDPDVGDTHTYTLVAGTGDTDNALFTIVGDELRTAAVLDFETQSSYSVRVRSEDADGLFAELFFVVLVTDLLD
jgi:hypothetical protein